MVELVLAVLLLLMAAAVVAYPLVFGSLESYVTADLPDEEYREPDALLEAMSELELSHGSGKISDEDYQTEKRHLQNQYLKTAAADSSDGGKKPRAKTRTGARKRPRTEARAEPRKKPRAN